MDDWTELALRARDGDTGALEELVRVSQRDVRAVCTHLGDPDTVDDLVQDTYWRAFRSLGGFRNDGTARSWLLAIARHTCADATRRRIRHRRRSSIAELPEIAVDGGSTAEVDELIARLTTDRRDAFVLTQLVGLSYAEAAEVCGCPVGTIRSRVARARDELLAALDVPGSDTGS
ncbi:MAG: sigma-70 family RNA polymerase sigma factor [Actinomycetota bacterium]